MQKSVYVTLVFCAFLAICYVVGIGCQTVTATNQDDSLYPWLSDRGISVISRSTTIREKHDCSNKTEAISFRGGYSTIACVYGDVGSVRVARYVNQGGLSVIGIAYPGEEKYSEVYGVCEGVAVCAYSVSRDVLVDSRTSRFYTDFAKNLVKMTNPVNGLPYYQFSRADLNKYISAPGPMRFNATTVSANGKWAVVEAYEYGFVRVDLDTFHQRRIAISGAQYGLANDPHFELAVSNSGREFVVVGDKAGIALYQVDNYCGDVLNAQSSHYFTNPSVFCRASSYNTSFFLNFLTAYSPVFNNDGTRLGLTVQTVTKRERVIAAPDHTIFNTSGQIQYLALGDSYTSGEGETANNFYKDGTDQDENKCHLSSRSYPYLLGVAQGITQSQSVACSGAQMGDIFGTTMYFGQKNQISRDEQSKDAADYQALARFMPGVVRQLDFVSKYQPKTVSIGIGGNDAGMMDKLKTCIGPGVCEWAKNPAMRLASAKEIQRLYGGIRSVIASLKTASPDTKIIFVGYPKIINEATSARCSTVLGMMLSVEERQFMDESIKVLNDTVKAAALSEGSKFVDVQDAFMGHRLCEADAKAMNGIRGGDDIAPIQRLSVLKLIGSESFHPTPYGHSLVASRVAAQVSILGDVDCSECTLTEPRPLSSYWTNGDNPSQIKKTAKGVVASEVAAAGQQISIAVGARWFRSQSSITIEIHSGSQRLGEVTLDETGKGETFVTIPKDSESGYHMLHLVGESWEGEPLDVYQLIQVTNADEEAVANNTENSKDSGNVTASTVKSESTSVQIKQLASAEPLLKRAPPSVLGADHSNKIGGALNNGALNTRDKKGAERASQPRSYLVAITVLLILSLIGVGYLLRRYISRHSM